jgi:CheY-like chemotaxis protein
VARILIVEDDDSIRSNIARMLKLEGHQTLLATNGREGLELARTATPDLILSDVSMPEMDGFAMLEALRAQTALASVPVLMLTALDDRASFRRGMTLGADDYLSKPFTRAELLEAVDAQIDKAEKRERSASSRLREQEEKLRQFFAEALTGKAHSEPLFRSRPGGQVGGETHDATVLVSEIHDFGSLTEKLSGAEITEMLSGFFERASAPVLAQRGRHLKFVGDTMIANFWNDDGDAYESHAARAVQSALAIEKAAVAFQEWLAGRYASRSLPAFKVTLVLASGTMTVCNLDSLHGEVTVIGDALQSAMRLKSQVQGLGWRVVAASSTAQLLKNHLRAGRRANASGQATGDVQAVEVLGLTDMSAGAVGAAPRAQPETPDSEMQSAMAANAEMTARAVKDALTQTLASIKDQADKAVAGIQLKGYQLLRKIGAGGMSEVFLAERDTDKRQVVLKILDMRSHASGEMLQRFIQEYAILSQIDHPHIVKIFDQGFTDEYAYIAMEYFSRGDIRALTQRQALPRDLSLAIIVQVAQALAEIHRRGIVHRDMKPENLMLRDDGSIALADFGVAKSESDLLAQTRHGEIVGTPYYLSPEQAGGAAATPASDLYGVGVILFELLTGQKPYTAESLEVLLVRHMHAPIPRLPEELRDLQHLVDRLLAKLPGERYQSADALLEALLRV